MMNDKARRIFNDSVTKAAVKKTAIWWMEESLSALPPKVASVVRKIKSMTVNPEFKDDFMVIIGMLMEADLSSFVTKDNYGVALIPISNPNSHNYPSNEVLLLLEGDQGIRRDGTRGNHLPLGDLECFRRPDEATILSFIQGLSDTTIRDLSGRL